MSFISHKTEELLGKAGFDKHSFNKYLKNTFWLLANKVLGIINSLIIGSWIARYLGPKEYGILNYALSYSAFFIIISNLGLDDIIRKEFVRKQWSDHEVFGTSIALRFIGGIIAYALLFLALYISKEKYTLYILIVSFPLLIQPLYTIELYYQSKVASVRIMIAQLAGLTISSLVKLYLVYFQYDFKYFVIFSTIEYCSIGIILLIVCFFDSQIHKKWQLKYLLVKNSLKSSWPLIFSGLAVVLYMRIDQIMIQQLLSETLLGQYSVVVKISEASYFIPTMVATSLYPAILKYKETNRKVYHLRLQQFYDLMFILSLCIIILTLLFSKILIHQLFGPSYDLSSEIIRLYIWSSIFVFLGVANTRWILTENLQHVTLKFTIAGALINIVLNYILIPRYELVGATIATLISQAMASFVFTLFDARTRPSFFNMAKTLCGISIISRIKNL